MAVEDCGTRVHGAACKGTLQRVHESSEARRVRRTFQVLLEKQLHAARVALRLDRRLRVDAPHGMLRLELAHLKRAEYPQATSEQALHLHVRRLYE